ncbi:MAG: hypothetical protein P857_1 [Candidatus Xenolissoclinum pacificiensis L6]|uniref:Uncharacterized protein n=1 Tax=Candidatus Xenolissoclinum pacificiensis L6 TaxID=1401685 RepID=W2UZY6_9RICK|nr:MAG: hypothetical protein P857_1 [Candidatus Xenolissoclinum pacificiensis L6]
MQEEAGSSKQKNTDNRPGYQQDTISSNLKKVDKKFSPQYATELTGIKESSENVKDIDKGPVIDLGNFKPVIDKSEDVNVVKTQMTQITSINPLELPDKKGPGIEYGR